MKRLATALVAVTVLLPLLGIGTSTAAAASPVVGVAATPSGDGHWVATADGDVRTDGDARSFGSLAGHRLNLPIVGIAATPTGRGYWLVARDGGIFSFGDARFQGSTGAIRLNQPIVGMTSTPSGGGYWLVAADGGIFSFGDARFQGSTGAIRLNQPIVGMASTPSGGGYWLVARDGGIFTFGDATFAGSAAPRGVPVVGMAASETGRGYWIAGERGDVFEFGDAQPLGKGAAPVAGIAAAKGYHVISRSGVVTSRLLGRSPVVPSTPAPAPAPKPAPASKPDAIFRSAYETLGSLSNLSAIWQSEQEPSVGGVRQDRITVVKGAGLPGQGAAKPAAAMRVELRPYDGGNGDVQGGKYNRAEVYGRHAPHSSTPPEAWPDPTGSTRWYQWSMLVPEGFELATDTKWLTLTQWKGFRGGSPPVAIEIQRGELQLAGAGPRRSLGAVQRGQWIDLVVGIHFRPDDQGWVEVWKDGINVLPRMHRATQERLGNGSIDPTYLKQGIYRTTGWKTTHVVFHGPMTITGSRPTR